MKKYLILFAIAVGMGQIDKASAWMKTYGSNDKRAGGSVQQTSDGGYVFSGTDTSGGAYLVKTNLVGDTLWTRIYKITQDHYFDAAGSFVQQTRDGGYIIAAGDTVRLIKTDSAGNIMWVKKGNMGGEGCGCVKQTLDKGYICTGWSKNSSGIFLCKTDSLGDTLWAKNYISYTSAGYSVQQTSDSGYIITGYRDHKDPPVCRGRIWLIKTDSNGDTLWTRTYGDTSCESEGRCVQQTLDGGYIVTGRINTLSSLWLLKADANGNTVWTKTYGGTGEQGHSVQQTADGGYIITGRSPFASPIPCWLLKTNSNGDTLWTKAYSGVGSAVQQTSDGGYIIEGPDGYNIFLLKTDSLGISDTTGIGEGGYNLQNTEYKLAVSPNPCVKIAKISYQVPSSVPDANRYGVHSQQSTVSLKVYDMAGKMVDTLVENGDKVAGDYILSFNKENLSSGIYFVELKSDNYKITKKLVFL